MQINLVPIGSRSFRLRTLLATLGILAMLSFAVPTSTAAQSDEPLIRVGAGADDASTPLIYATHAGLFKKAGLNVELEKIGSGSVVAAALAGGSLEIGKASTTAVVTAYARGLPFTIIGAIANYDPEHSEMRLLVSASSPIKTAKDLSGQTMGTVSLQDQGALATFEWLEQRGVDWHQLKIVEIPPAASLAAMGEKRIGFSDVFEPYLSTYLATGEVRVIGDPFAAVSRRFAEAVLFGNVNWVSRHQDLVERFLRVVADASAYVGAHEDEVRPLVAQFGGLDPVATAKVVHSARGVALRAADIQPVIDLLAKYGVVPKGFPAQDLICSCAQRH